MSGPLAEGNDGFGGSGVSGIRGSNSVVESQPSKLLVAGSIPVSRSKYSAAVSQKMVVGGDGCFVAPVYLERDTGRCSSAVERVLGKDEVTGSSPVIGSRMNVCCRRMMTE